MKTPSNVHAVSRLGRISRTLTKTLILSGAAALAAYSPSATFAEEGVRQVRVRYDDLNLASRSGVETLKRRIRNAAESVCDDGAAHQPELWLEYARCVNDKARDALSRVNWPEGSRDFTG